MIAWAALALTVARGAAPGEVTLQWEGEDGPFAVARAFVPALVDDPGAHLANTAAASLVDASAPPLAFYRVVGTTCGNLQIDPGEECDDGGHAGGDGCTSRCLREAHRCLRPGGRIVCLGPNIRVLHGKYWDFFDHHTPLSDLSLKEALELRGFEVGTCIERFLPYTMSGRRPAPLWTVRAYLRMPWAWRFFGGQFLVVGEK